MIFHSTPPSEFICTEMNQVVNKVTTYTVLNCKWHACHFTILQSNFTKIPSLNSLNRVLNCTHINKILLFYECSTSNYVSKFLYMHWPEASSNFKPRHVFLLCVCLTHYRWMQACTWTSVSPGHHIPTACLATYIKRKSHL
jgi:hypothetical protein